MGIEKCIDEGEFRLRNKEERVIVSECKILERGKDSKLTVGILIKEEAREGDGKCEDECESKAKATDEGKASHGGRISQLWVCFGQRPR